MSTSLHVGKATSGMSASRRKSRKDLTKESEQLVRGIVERWAVEQFPHTRRSELSDAQRVELRGKLQSFKAMSREDRNRVLKRYNRFLELSEGRRNQLRQQYKAFTQLPVREREGIRENFRRYKKFSPERREQMRRMHERLSNMSPEERRRFREKMRRWKRLSPEQRRKLRERAGGGGPQR